MGTVNDIITLANAQLGNGGSRYWNWYTDSVNPAQGYYVDGDKTPYCAEYISWLLAQTDTNCIHFPNSVAFDWREIPESQRITKYNVQAGDIVSYDWDADEGGDHVGLVLEAHSWGILANEGNTSGGIVKNRERYWSNILFGVRPAYSGDDAQPHKLDVDGWIGPLSVTRMQQWLGTYQDGVISGQGKADDEYRERVIAIDYHGDGSPMVRALQGYLGIDVDGYWGYYTSKALQWLIGARMDGYFGPESATKLQQYLNELEF